MTCYLFSKSYFIIADKYEIVHILQIRSQRVKSNNVSNNVPNEIIKVSVSQVMSFDKGLKLKQVEKNECRKGMLSILTNFVKVRYNKNLH